MPASSTGLHLRWEGRHLLCSQVFFTDAKNLELFEKCTCVEFDQA